MSYIFTLQIKHEVMSFNLRVTNYNKDMSFIMSTFPKVFSIVSLSLKPRFILFTLFSLLISFKILIFTNNLSIPQATKVIHLDKQSLPLAPLWNKVEPPTWLDVIKGVELAHKGALRMGLLNFEADQHSRLLLGEIVGPVIIDLELVPNNVTWKKIFPHEMSDKSSRKCPKIPMPKAMKYPKLDVVVAQLPCGEGYNRSDMKAIRDVHRLQVSLSSAHLIVENSMMNNGKHVYGVFISKCEPMVEMFRCDDLIWHEGDYWIYKPNVERLREIISMPIGTCELARPYVGDLGRRQLQTNSISNYQPIAKIRPKQAYVTMLHSSEAYVCGAIALAQSLLLTNTTKDLILLADSTISNHSIAGLQLAGWTVKLIERIRSPYANPGDYNAWNYSKLRVWQLIEYSKVMFIDSDFIVLRNIDHFFEYPQLSAAPDHDYIFNSGVTLVEPSECFFKTLMSKRFIMKSYNGGDQGYLNEIFTYWHRLSRKLNSMKIFIGEVKEEKRVVPKDQYAIHFFGLKPWSCYRDYDCNWDRTDLHRYASDYFHARWWKAYDAMPKELQMYCGMSDKQDATIRQWRVSARVENRSDGHWKIELKDPRQFNLVGLA